MRRINLFFTIFTTTFLLSTSLYSAKHHDSHNIQERSITVTGRATTHVAPDIILWQISATTMHQNLSQAKGANDKQIKAIIKMAKKFKIKDKDIQTGRLDITKEYHHEKYGNRGKFKHFELTRQVTLKQKNLKKFDQFLSALVKNTDINVNYSLSVSNLEELKAETRLKAVVAGRDKARALLKQLDEKLGPVLTLSENPTSHYKRLESMANVSFMRSPQSGGGSGGSGSTFAAGSIEVKASVHITFAIE
tara:strand:+ start:879 stop:1625 length:747 start_codon:yes stop_codon:yes gene_type:complete